MSIADSPFDNLLALFFADCLIESCHEIIGSVNRNASQPQNANVRDTRDPIIIVQIESLQLISGADVAPVLEKAEAGVRAKVAASPGRALRAHVIYEFQVRCPLLFRLISILYPIMTIVLLKLKPNPRQSLHLTR